MKVYIFGPLIGPPIYNHKMNTKLRYLFALIFFLITSTLSGQVDYIKQDTLTFFGIEFQKSSLKNNSRFIQVNHSNDSIVLYSPYAIDSYGFENGTVYEALTIDSLGVPVRYFFERLLNERLQLYSLSLPNENDRFFIKNSEDESLVEIPQDKQTYLSFLDSVMADCPIIAENLKFLKLNRNHLLRIFRDYFNCEFSYLPRFRLALKLDLGRYTYFPDERDELFSGIDLGYKSRTRMSINFISPIGMKNFSLISGLGLIRTKSSFTFENPVGSFDLLDDNWQLEVPLTARYSLYSQKYVPYVELGGGYRYLLKQNSLLLSYIELLSSEDILIDIMDIRQFPKQHVEIIAAIGSNLFYNSRFSLDISFQYRRLYPFERMRNDFSSQEMDLSIGILF